MLVATPLLGSGGGGIDVSVDCVAGSAAAPRARAARVARPAAGPACAAAAASTTSCLARLSAQRQGEQLSERCFAWHDRLAQGCQGLFDIAGLPWHADPIRRVARRTFTGLTPVLYIPVPYLWYLKGTLWRYTSYDVQAPGLPTTETYGQLDLSSHRRISTQSDADNKYEISALPPLPQPPTPSTPRQLLLLRIFRLVAVTTRRPSRYFWAVQLVQLVRCSTNRTAQRRVLLPTPRTAERR